MASLAGSALATDAEGGCEMTDPIKELRDYLEKLINRLLYVQSLRDQLKLYQKWQG